MDRPSVPPDEPTGRNKERSGQSTEARGWAGSRPRGRRSPGSHIPGDGQAVGTVNTCEPAIKIVTTNEPKWLSFQGTGGSQARAKRQRGSERGFDGAASWTLNPPVDSRYLPPRMLQERNVETPYISCRCQSLRQPMGCEAEVPASGSVARRIDRCAGLRCRKKPTPRCNGADTGGRLTGRESEPTSDGSFVARESDEPS